jgi:elongation factor P--beta-lysine ligase
MGFLRRRARVAAGVRAFFGARGYLEVETPYAVVAPGEEVKVAATVAAEREVVATVVEEMEEVVKVEEARAP